MHHVVVRLRAEADRLEGTVFCGPAEVNGTNDISCVKGTVIDAFTIRPYGLAPGAPPPEEEEEEEEEGASKHGELRH